LGMGKGKVRYRTSSLPKNRSGSGEVISAGTFPINSKIDLMSVKKTSLSLYHIKMKNRVCEMARVFSHIYSVADPDPGSGVFLPGIRGIRNSELRNSF
jgi:hypothetical protein